MLSEDYNVVDYEELDSNSSDKALYFMCNGFGIMHGVRLDLYILGC